MIKFFYINMSIYSQDLMHWIVFNVSNLIRFLLSHNILLKFKNTRSNTKNIAQITKIFKVIRVSITSLSNWFFYYEIISKALYTIDFAKYLSSSFIYEDVDFFTRLYRVNFKIFSFTIVVVNNSSAMKIWIFFF